MLKNNFYLYFGNLILFIFSIALQYKHVYLTLSW